jgi:hypothetical protein
MRTGGVVNPKRLLTEEPKRMTDGELAKYVEHLRNTGRSEKFIDAMIKQEKSR